MPIGVRQLYHQCSLGTVTLVFGSVGKEGLVHWEIKLQDGSAELRITRCPRCGEALPKEVDVTVKAK